MRHYKKKEKIIIKAVEPKKSKSKTTSEKVVKDEMSSKLVKKDAEKQLAIGNDIIDGIVDKLFPLVEKVQSKENSKTKETEEAKDGNPDKNNVVVEEEKENFDAVQEALTILIGENPSEEEKLSPEVFNAVLELDKFLREQEKERTKKKTQVDDLLNSALDYVDTAVSKREEAEERLVKLRRDEDDTKHSSLAKILSGLRLTPSELERILQ